jgi:hypothetical protein
MGAGRLQPCLRGAAAQRWPVCRGLRPPARLPDRSGDRRGFVCRLRIRPRYWRADRGAGGDGGRCGHVAAGLTRDCACRLARPGGSTAGAGGLGKLQWPGVRHRPHSGRLADRPFRLAERLPGCRAVGRRGIRVAREVVPESADPTGRSLDIAGQILGAIALGGLVFGVIALRDGGAAWIVSLV